MIYLFNKGGLAMKYYGIKEAAARTGLTAYTLRYYDKMGLLPFVERSESGLRKFKEEDFERLELINCLKDTGMKLEEICIFMEWSLEGNETLKQRLQLFRDRKKAVNEQIAKLKDTRELLEHKIEYYEKAIEAEI